MPAHPKTGASHSQSAQSIPIPFPAQCFVLGLGLPREPERWASAKHLANNHAALPPFASNEISLDFPGPHVTRSSGPRVFQPVALQHLTRSPSPDPALPRCTLHARHVVTTSQTPADGRRVRRFPTVRVVSALSVRPPSPPLKSLDPPESAPAMPDSNPDEPSPKPPTPASDYPSRPSSSSTHIAVGMHSTPEEDLYAAAEAMREAMRSKSMGRCKGKGKAATPTTTTTTRTAAATSPPPSASATTLAHATTTTTTTTSSPAHSPSQHSSPSSTTSSHHTHPPSETDQSPTNGTTTTTGGGGPFAFDDDMARYPASMTSSVRDHVYEGGLRYHAYRAGKYAFPNDETEQNRDDMKHTMTLMLCRGAYFYAPVEEVLERGGEVLDLGESSFFLSRCFINILLPILGSFFFFFLEWLVFFWLGGGSVGGELDRCEAGLGPVGVRGAVRGRSSRGKGTEERMGGEVGRGWTRWG